MKSLHFLLLAIALVGVYAAPKAHLSPSELKAWHKLLSSRLGNPSSPRHVTRQASGGLTLDPCTTNAECQAPRTCTINGAGEAPCPVDGAPNCRCSPPEGTVCQNDDDCVEGEKCFDIPGARGDICVSEGFDGNFPDSPTSPPTNPNASPSPSPSSGGLNLDPCVSDDDCQGERECINPDEEECGGPDENCRCVDLNPDRCDSDEDCDEGEVCSDDAVDDGSLCVSQGAEEQRPTDAPPPPPTATPEPTEDPICVDARALAHLSMDELVFETHRKALVLCDQFESCATPGHMVTFKGKPMMMSTYCQMTSCVKKRMPVNSPSYRVAIRVKSNTEHLEYTAFAARYNTRAEEAILKTAVHIGL